ncbi:serine protease 30-like [Athalia rosae]|uniref:serine protease 30-like n=1 Tax=Athalia rosae TaxID=37344 RepID=UPI002033C703|nr:serine protease 30-like [Athalia rosae]
MLLFSKRIIIAHAYHRGIVTRVVGGQPTSVIKYPFMVSLQKKAFGHICGGTYLHGINVLSAAHCFIAHGEVDFRVENPLLFIAIAGASDVNSLYVPSMQIRLVVHIEVHPRYNNTSKFNDIALIRLDRAFTPAKEVLPVALGPVSIVNELLLRSSNATADPAIFCQVLGWGYLQEASPVSMRNVNVQTSFSVASAARWVIRHFVMKGMQFYLMYLQ